MLLLKAMSQKKPHPLQGGGWGKGCLKVAQSLAHEDAAWVGFFAAIELKQKIQSWEAKDFNFWAAAWACAGENVCNAIAIAIVDSNTNAAGKGFCVSHELGK